MSRGRAGLGDGVRGRAPAGRARPPREVYAFLRRALLLIPASRPYRGPAAYEEGEFVYGNQWEGGPERFRGVERIGLAGRPVYELVYAGGLLR